MPWRRGNWHPGWLRSDARPWLWSDGSPKGIAATIKNGVPQPKQHTGAMPPYGGIKLGDSELDAVAAYVWALGHR